MTSTAPVAASPSREVLVSLQYLRAVAALMVVYFHAAIQAQTLARWQVDLPLVGSSGVDIFFVLSGFVMYTSTHGRDVTIVDFATRRFIRIVPLYWLLTLAVAGAAALAPSLLRSTVFDPAHLVASLTFVPWPNPVANPLNPTISPVIVPGWTLNFEMMFYALFAASLFVRGDQARLVTMSALVAALFGASWLLREQAIAARFYASPIIFEFVAGAWIAAALQHRGAPRSPRIAMAVLAIALTSILVDEWLWSDHGRLLTLGLPAVVIVTCAVLIERTGRLRFSRLWAELGNASYSIYLSHIFVVAGLRIALELLGRELTPPFGILFVLAAIVLASALGLMIHTLIEKPLTRAVNSALRGTRQRRDLPVSVA